jgi:hypothetical protein
MLLSHILTKFLLFLPCSQNLLSRRTVLRFGRKFGSKLRAHSALTFYSISEKLFYVYIPLNIDFPLLPSASTLFVLRLPSCPSREGDVGNFLPEHSIPPNIRKPSLHPETQYSLVFDAGRPWSSIILLLFC